MIRNMQKLFDLSGKAAVITGAGSGLGQGISEGYAQLGAGVSVVDVNPEAAQSVAEETRGWLSRDPALAAGKHTSPEHRFYVTDAPEPFAAVAERFLGKPIERLERARIEGE